MWNLEIDSVIMRNMKYIKNLYSVYSVMKVKPGEKKYMCYQEFVDMVNQSGILLVGKAGASDIGAIFNVSMMT